MNKKEEIKEILKGNSLFQDCSPHFIDDLASRSCIKSVDKGQVIFVQQDESEHFCIVQKGWVKLYRETLDGTQAVIDILPAGYMFGETSIFEDGLYPYSAEPAEASLLLLLPLKLLKSEIESNPKFALAMLSNMAKYRKQQDKEIEHLSIQNAPQRIGCFLLRLANQNKVGQTSIHLPYDKTLVASRLGMQPETFSRALSKLKKETGIEVKGATIKLKDIDQLVKYSCVACSSEFPCKQPKEKTA